MLRRPVEGQRPSAILECFKMVCVVFIQCLDCLTIILGKGWVSNVSRMAIKFSSRVFEDDYDNYLSMDIQIVP